MIYARSSAKRMGRKTDGTEECKDVTRLFEGHDEADFEWWVRVMLGGTENLKSHMMADSVQ